jgi:hypothetical protein
MHFSVRVLYFIENRKKSNPNQIKIKLKNPKQTMRAASVWRKIQTFQTTQPVKWLQGTPDGGVCL